MNKLTLLIAGVAVVGGTVFAWNLSQAPQGHSMTPPDTSGIGKGEAIARVKVPAELGGLAGMGKIAFEAKCASCHGENAAGRQGFAPPLVHKIYEPNHHGDMSFQSAARNGVQSHHWDFGNMPPVDGLTTGDIKGIVAYVRELQRENGIF